MERKTVVVASLLVAGRVVVFVGESSLPLFCLLNHLSNVTAPTLRPTLPAFSRL